MFNKNAITVSLMLSIALAVGVDAFFVPVMTPSFSRIPSMLWHSSAWQIWQGIQADRVFYGLIITAVACCAAALAFLVFKGIKHATGKGFPVKF